MTSSRRLICVLCSVHVISRYFECKGLPALFKKILITHKSARSGNLGTWIWWNSRHLATCMRTRAGLQNNFKWTCARVLFLFLFVVCCFCLFLFLFLFCFVCCFYLLFVVFIFVCCLLFVVCFCFCFVLFVVFVCCFYFCFCLLFLFVVFVFASFVFVAGYSLLW